VRIRVFAACLLMTGCAMGPNYKRPQTNLPASFRGSERPVDDRTVQVANLPWWQLFKDEQLQTLIRTGLQRNFDFRTAAARIDEVRASFVRTRADQFPTIEQSNTFTERQFSRRGGTPLPPGLARQRAFTASTLDLAFEIDLWGRFRRLTEAARADLLAQEWAQRAVTTSLVAEIAQTYFDLRELDLELEISQRTLATREQSLDLTKARKDRGVASGLDVRQAENLVYTAAARIPDLKRQIAQTEHRLSLLLGDDPADVPRGKALVDQVLPEIPAGLPSTLLERRPDIVQAEQSLVAANARIGAAKAAFFPNLSLTGLFGTESAALGNYLSEGARTRTLPIGSTLPLFNAGRVRAGVREAEARRQQAVIAYDRAIRTAMREIADALAGVRHYKEQRAQQESLVAALQDAQRLSELRYRGGVDSYLQVLDSERALFEAQLALARVRRDELTASVQLYRALGGGWAP
jgi:outer membrane protein, multidrug efflux system